MNLYVNIYPKVVRDLNIIGNIPGIFLKKPGKIMEISWNFVSSEMWKPCILYCAVYPILYSAVYPIIYCAVYPILYSAVYPILYSTVCPILLLCIYKISFIYILL